MKKILYKIPKLPLSALVFYLGVLILWRMNIIPSPSGIFLFLENLYASYGLIGLFIASFLEGIVYFGLYFPGSFIVAIAVILSDGSLNSLLSISITVAVALTITSLINYFLGKRIIKNSYNNDVIGDSKVALSKGLVASALHPNALAFYFFNSGIKKQNFLKFLLVPIIMIPYGLALGYFLYSIRDGLKVFIENPYVMISCIIIWMIIAFMVEAFNKN